MLIFYFAILHYLETYVLYDVKITVSSHTVGMYIMNLKTIVSFTKTLHCLMDIYPDSILVVRRHLQHARIHQWLLRSQDLNLIQYLEIH